MTSGLFTYVSESGNHKVKNVQDFKKKKKLFSWTLKNLNVKNI